MSRRQLLAQEQQTPLKNPWSIVLYYSLPVMALQWLACLSSTIIPRFLAHYHTHALAASALTYRAFLIILLCMNGFQFAQGVIIARTPESKRHLMIKQCSTLILGVCLLCACFLWAMPWILTLSHQSPQLIPLTIPYFHVLALTCPLMALNGLWQQLLLVYRKPIFLVIIAVLYCVAAIFFSHLFILGSSWMPATGLAGSAWGELSAQTCVAVLTCLLIIFFVPQLSFRSIWPICKSKLSAYKAQWSLGWPIALRWMNEMFAMAIITLLIGHFGATALGSFRVVSQIELLLLMIPYSINIALGILISSASTPQMVGKFIQKSLALTCLPLFICSLLFWAIPSWLLIHVFGLQPHQYAIIQLGTKLLMITALAQIFNGAREVINGALRALGDTLFPLLFSIIGFWGIGVGGAWIGTHYWHGQTVLIWWMLTAAYTVACL